MISSPTCRLSSCSSDLAAIMCLSLQKILGIGAMASLLCGAPQAFAFDPQAANEVNMSSNSLYCTICHDGVLAREIHRGHSVDVSYAVAQLRSRGRLKPQAMLDPALSLPNGQLVCTTCHQPQSPFERKLVISNRGSALCLACHNP